MKRKKPNFDEKTQQNSILNYFSPKSQKVSQVIAVSNDDTSESNTFDLQDDDLHSSSPGYLVYYFDILTKEVLNNKNDVKLFSIEELELINTYDSLPNPSKTLFLRHYCRSWKWRRLDKEKTKNVDQIAQILIENNFMTNKMTDLNYTEKLNFLTVKEIQLLIKRFHLHTLSKNKSVMIDTIIDSLNNKHKISNYFSSQSTGLSYSQRFDIELDKCIKSIVKLTKSTRKTFSKLTVLSGLTTSLFDDDNCSHFGERMQKDIFFLLQVKKGGIIFPNYQLSRQSNIFSESDQLDVYCIAVELFYQLRFFINSNKFTEADQIFREIEREFPRSVYLTAGDSRDMNYHFLDRFRLASLICRLYSLSVTIFEKQRLYRNAIDILESLLAATESNSPVGVSKSRGKWYLRIIINYQTHLNDRCQTQLWLERAIHDPSVPDSMMFRNRLEKLMASNKKKNNNKFTDNSNDSQLFESLHFPLVQITEKSIEAPRQTDLIEEIRRPRYIWRNENEIVYCVVEEYVIYYAIRYWGFSHGIHGETGTFVILFLLLFYDIIYADIPDVFYSYRQTVPLDMFSSSFRSNRQDLINEKLDWFRNRASEQDVVCLLTDNWRNHVNELGIVSNWGVIESEEKLLGLFSCIGLELVLKICEKFLDNFHYWQSGMPDLVVWNTETRHYEIIEVKGRNDKLSDKQRLWISELQKMNANVSLCHVKS